MNRDNLYDAAFRYKKSGLWKKLWDSDVFAIKLKSGEIGYISIMGKGGEYNAIGLYIGEKGFGSYRLLASSGGSSGSPFKDHEMLLQQNCLQVAFESKDELMPEEVDEVRAYAKKNSIKLTGKNAYPQFLKYEPGCYPWKVKTEEDMEALHTAIIASALMADVLKTVDPQSIGIFPVKPDMKEVPLFEVKGEALIQAGMAPLPGDLEEKYEYVKAANQIDLAYVKKLPRKGIWEAEYLCMMEPVQNKPEETPYFPMLLLIVESRDGYILHIPMIDHSEKNPDALLHEFANSWKTQKAGPKEIRCRDERTYALLKDFCEKTGVKISIYRKAMHALDEAEAALLAHSSGADEDEMADQMEEIVDMILSMSKSELKIIPKPLIEQLRVLIEQDVFPEDIATALERKLRGL